MLWSFQRSLFPCCNHLLHYNLHIVLFNYVCEVYHITQILSILMGEQKLNVSIFLQKLFTSWIVNQYLHFIYQIYALTIYDLTTISYAKYMHLQYMILNHFIYQIYSLTIYDLTVISCTKYMHLKYMTLQSYYSDMFRNDNTIFREYIPSLKQFIIKWITFMNFMTFCTSCCEYQFVCG